MRTKDYLFAQDLKCMPREIANTLLCNLATFPYVFYYKFELILCIISTRHHLIFVLVNRELLTVFKEKVEECECGWPSVANGMVGWSLYIVWPFSTCPTTLKVLWFKCRIEEINSTIKWWIYQKSSVRGLSAYNWTTYMQDRNLTAKPSIACYGSKMKLANSYAVFYS